MSTWSVDPAHSQIQFAVKHMMVTTVRGGFGRFTADLDFDEERPEQSSVVVHIDASSVDTGMEARDAHLRSADFFDVERFPQAVFHSTSITRNGEQSYRIDGELTIKDVTLPISLEAEIEGVVPNLQGGRRAAFSAATKISRKQWGLNWNVALESGGWLVGDEIRLTLELAAVQSVADAEKQVEIEESPAPETVSA